MCNATVKMLNENKSVEITKEIKYDRLREDHKKVYDYLKINAVGYDSKKTSREIEMATGIDSRNIEHIATRLKTNRIIYVLKVKNGYFIPEHNDELILKYKLNALKFASIKIKQEKRRLEVALEEMKNENDTRTI